MGWRVVYLTFCIDFGGDSKGRVWQQWQGLMQCEVSSRQLLLRKETLNPNQSERHLNEREVSQVIGAYSDFKAILCKPWRRLASV